MTAISTLAIIFFLGSGCLAGIAALAIALNIFIAGVFPDAGVSVYLVCLAAAFAIPMSGMLAAIFLEEFSGAELRFSGYRQIATVLCASVILPSPIFYNYLASALELTRRFSTAQAIAFVCAYGSAVFFCASLVALVLMLFAVLPELLMRWASGALSSFLFFPYGAVRQLLIIIGFAASINLAIGLFEAELSPLKIFSRLPK